ncbi:hypothetical protein [Streptomyces sp. NPDC050738]|uniref:hypothetical protein n=1 Tax=Streptomyces sp. NPDC050738 TaxID=3154744 RepID=UPI003413DEAE
MTTAQDNPRRPVRMCVDCQMLTDDPVLVAEVHQATGPGFGVYACRACAPQPIMTTRAQDGGVSGT